MYKICMKSLLCTYINVTFGCLSVGVRVAVDTDYEHTTCRSGFISCSQGRDSETRESYSWRVSYLVRLSTKVFSKTVHSINVSN